MASKLASQSFPLTFISVRTKNQVGHLLKIKHVIDPKINNDQTFWFHSVFLQMQSDNCHLSDAVHEWLKLIDCEELQQHKHIIQARFDKAMEPFHFLAYICDHRYEGIYCY